MHLHEVMTKIQRITFRSIACIDDPPFSLPLCICVADGNMIWVS